MTYKRIDLSRYCVLSIWFGCNNRCDICMLSRVENNLPPIGFEHFQKILRQIAEGRKYENLILSGAEVTIFEKLEEYVHYAASLNRFEKIQIQTNGRRLKDGDYARRLIRCGVNEFFISIQGMEGSHDAITGVPGSFSETIAGLRNVAGQGANAISNTVLTRNNMKDIVPLFDYLAREPVSEMQLWNFFPMERHDTGDRIVSIEAFCDLLPGLAALAERAGKPITFKSFPQCLSTGRPLFFDSRFPSTVLPDLFWEQFQECGFGRCYHRETGRCGSSQCWGLSSAYLGKYGDSRELLKPIAED